MAIYTGHEYHPTDRTMAILAAVDGEHVPSETVTVAYDLAQDLGDELVVVHVLSQELFESMQERGDGTFGLPPTLLAPEITYGDDTRETDDDGRYTAEDAQNDAREVAQRVVENTLDEWSDITSLGRVGEPAAQILNESDRLDARYLVIGGRRRTPVGKAVFGSITQSILLNAELPVVTSMQDE
jgi:nucleotide-binding universal stress UspA family protein